jgi:hypothetical protein
MFWTIFFTALGALTTLLLFTGIYISLETQHYQSIPKDR